MHQVTFTVSRGLSAGDQFQPAPVQVTLTVTAVTDFVDSGMFVFRVDRETLSESFVGVSNPADLSAYQFNSVGDNQFVRRSTVTRILQTADLVDEFVTTVEADIAALCALMDIVVASGTTQTIIVP